RVVRCARASAGPAGAVVAAVPVVREHGGDRPRAAGWGCCMGHVVAEEAANRLVRRRYTHEPCRTA
uniref:hypothetical protein n=1 Tax=Allorhizocola rhizosphaerae TaxID=1872709 RepID=UPI001B8BB327